MLHVYAVIPAHQKVPGVEMLSCGDVAAAFRRDAAPPAPPTAERVAAHARVVGSILARHPLLPARFGTAFPDEAALREALARHHDALLAGLKRVSGCVELGVRVLWPQVAADPPPSTAPTGRDYMLARAAEERRRHERQRAAEDLVKRIHPPLAELARDATHRVLPAPNTPIVAAYLVPHDGAEHFRRRVAQLDDAHDDVTLICTGPWPPYHFAPALGHEEAARA